MPKEGGEGLSAPGIQDVCENDYPCFCLLLATLSLLRPPTSLTGQGWLPHPASATAALRRRSQVGGAL